MRLPQRRSRFTRYGVLAAISLTTATLLVGAVVWQLFEIAVPHPSESKIAGPGGVAVSIVDLPLALVADYYAHIGEHVPPQHKGGVMQMRERYYRPPQDPFVMLRFRLGSGRSEDEELADGLARAEDHWLKTGILAAEDKKAFEGLTASHSLDAVSLMEAGRGFQFLAGDEIASIFFRAGVTKAESQFKDVPPGDSSALPFLRLLDQTAALYRVNDQITLAQRFALAMRLYPTLSVESRRSACLCAQALSTHGNAQEAADTILEAWRQDLEVGDLGLFDRRDVPEMDWRAAKYLSAADRYAEAIPYYADFIRMSSDEAQKREAVVLWRICLNRLGNTPEAAELRAKYPPPPSPAASQRAATMSVQ